MSMYIQPNNWLFPVNGGRLPCVSFKYKPSKTSVLLVLMKDKYKYLHHLYISVLNVLFLFLHVN